MSEPGWDPHAEVRCAHAEQCGACPLMRCCYDEQCDIKVQRLEQALGRYGVRPVHGLAAMGRADPIVSYRRRAKLVVCCEPDERDVPSSVGSARAPRPALAPSAMAERSAPAGGSRVEEPGRGVVVGLYQREDSQRVVDVSNCVVLSPGLRTLVQAVRRLAADPPGDCAALLAPARDGSGVLLGIDARELYPPLDGNGTEPSLLLTLVLAADRAAPVEQLRECAAALSSRLPMVKGLAASLRPAGRPQSSAELVVLAGETEGKDAIGSGYQLVSHTSFLHVHRQQAARLYRTLTDVVAEAVGPGSARVLDLYGGTGAFALSLAAAGHNVTLVESYPPSASLAQRAAQAQRLPVEVVTGDVASITRALAGAGAKFDLALANPPRRGLSPAAREALACLGAPSLVYVACDLDNLSRDLDHLARLGYELDRARMLDMLPLTEEIEVVALLRRASPPAPAVLHREPDLIAVDKAAHEPCCAHADYPASLTDRLPPELRSDEWIPLLDLEPSTSGVCLLARGADAAERWSAALRYSGRLVYLAAVRGVTPAKGAITRELRGAPGGDASRTRYRRLAIGGGHSVLRVVPEQPRPHQIRRHLASIGHPVLGDARYGHAPTNRYFEEKHGLDRSFLHLVRIEILHPRTGQRLLLESPLTADLRAALARASDESVLRFLENKRALGSRLRPSPDDPVPSERSPLSLVEPEVESCASPQLEPLSQRSAAVDLDDAPRTIRGELLTTGDED